MKKSITLATALASVLSSGIATADLSANAGVFSNYIWRGVTQTQDNAAGQGGIDYSHESGVYAGLWTSTITDGQEVDLYGGFAGEIDKFGYDLGFITYQFPKTPEFNFTEVNASASFGFDAATISAGVAYTVDAASGNDGGAFDTGDVYGYGSLDFPLGKTDVSIYGGYYSFDNDSSSNDLDYAHYGISVGKDGFALALDKNDLKDSDAIPQTLGVSSMDNIRVTVSYSVDFEL
ncbi:MAG: TorF family putative porin [Gammaproteobacteria bacterium]|nr:TorF family putative porin [Gammaproteobacteria bacterium]